MHPGKGRCRHLGRGDLCAHGVRGEQGEGNEGSGADGETLADGGGGVAGGVERVSSLTHVVTWGKCEEMAAGRTGEAREARG